MMYPCVSIIYDIETGGLWAHNNPIIEIAMIGLDQDMKEVFRYEQFVKPYKGKDGVELKVEQGALNANNIDMREVMSKGIEGKDLYKDLVKIFKESKRGKFNKPILVGHNNCEFDNSFLEYLFDLYEKRERDTCQLWKYVSKFNFDTMFFARQRTGHVDTMANYQLGTCCSTYGIELLNAHRAMNDVEATKELYKKFISIIRSEGTIVEQRQRFRETFQF